MQLSAEEGPVNRTLTPRAGLVLPGGGARGAFQVGVLRAIAEISAQTSVRGFPFPIVTGTSAGAINAAVIASHADSLAHGAARLEEFWRSLHCERIYRTDAWNILCHGLRMMLSFTPLVSRIVDQPESLLDNRPLRDFLDRELLLGQIQQGIDRGDLHGLAITASGYTCASAISFFQASGELFSSSAIGRGVRMPATTSSPCAFIRYSP